MGSRRQLIFFLVFQVLAAVWAVLCFRLFSVRLHAALLAGGGFLLMGVSQFVVSLSWSHKWRSVSFYVVSVFTFLLTMPMLYMRLTKVGSFYEAQIMGFNGTQFHRASEVVYVLLVVATVWDLWRFGRGRETD